MLEDDVVATTKRTVVSMFDGRSSGGGKGKRSRRDEDIENKRHDGIQIHVLGTRGKTSSNHRQSDNPNLNNDSKQVRFTISPAQLVPIIQSLPGFTWPPLFRGDPEGRDKS